MTNHTDVFKWRQQYPERTLFESFFRWKLAKSVILRLEIILMLLCCFQTRLMKKTARVLRIKQSVNYLKQTETHWPALSFIYRSKQSDKL